MSKKLTKLKKIENFQIKISKNYEIFCAVFRQLPAFFYFLKILKNFKIIFKIIPTRSSPEHVSAGLSPTTPSLLDPDTAASPLSEGLSLCKEGSSENWVIHRPDRAETMCGRHRIW